MKKFTVNRFKPQPGHPGVWETVLLRGGQLLFLTQDVIDNMQYDIESTRPEQGFDLFAYCIEDEWVEYNRKLVTVKVITLAEDENGCECGCNNKREVPDWFDKSLLLYVVKNKMGQPIALVCKDMDCWYWQYKERAKEIIEELKEIYPGAFTSFS